MNIEKIIEKLLGKTLDGLGDKFSTWLDTKWTWIKNNKRVTIPIAVTFFIGFGYLLGSDKYIDRESKQQNLNNTQIQVKKGEIDLKYYEKQKEIDFHYYEQSKKEELESLELKNEGQHWTNVKTSIEVYEKMKQDGITPPSDMKFPFVIPSSTNPTTSHAQPVENKPKTP